MNRSSGMLLLVLLLAGVGAFGFMQMRAAERRAVAAQQRALAATLAQLHQEAEAAQEEQESMARRSEQIEPAAPSGATPPQPDQPTQSPADPTAEPTAEPGTAESAEISVRVFLADQVSYAPIAPFQLTVRQKGPNGESLEQVIQPAEDGHTVQVAPGEFELLAEAEGHQPVRWSGEASADGTQPAEIRLYTQTAQKAAGISFTVTDTYNQPVPIIRAELTPTEPAGQQPLWLRQNEIQDGVHELPESIPGTYRLRLWAVDNAGNRLPLTEHVERGIVFTGSERLEFQAQLQPAALLEVIVRDSAGRDLGQEISLRLSGPPGTVAPDTWVGTENGSPVARVRGLPTTGPALLDGSLAAGGWRLDVFRNGEPVATRELNLPVGQQSQIVIQLP